MNKKNLKFAKKNKYAILAASIALIVLVAGMGIVRADVSFWDKVAQYTGLSIADKVEVPNLGDVSEDVSLGAFPGPDIYERVYFHDGFSGRSSIDIPIRQVASSTAADLGPAGYWCNNEAATTSVSNWWWEIGKANNGFAANWSIGTTTLISGSRYTPGVNSFTNTSTATIVASSFIGTSTTGIFDVIGYGVDRYTGFDPSINATSSIGSYYTSRWGTLHSTTTPFHLLRNECIVIYSDNSGATSSESIIVGGGESTYRPLIGTFHADAVFSDE